MNDFFKKGCAIISGLCGPLIACVVTAFFNLPVTLFVAIMSPLGKYFRLRQTFYAVPQENTREGVTNGWITRTIFLLFMLVLSGNAICAKKSTEVEHQKSVGPTITSTVKHKSISSLSGIQKCMSVFNGFGKVEEDVWSHICAGTETKYEINKKDYPILNPNFIVEILSNKHYRDLIPFHGIQIRNVKFVSKLDLQQAVIDVPLKIENSIFDIPADFDAPADFTAMKASRSLSLSGSEFNCNSINKSRRSKKDEAEVIHFDGAQIDGDIKFTGAQFNNCQLDMRRVKVKGALFLDEVMVTNVNPMCLKRPTESNIDPCGGLVLSNANITDKVSLEDSNICCHADMNYIQIGTKLQMYSSTAHNAAFDSIFLENSQIHGEAKFRGILANSLTLKNAQIDGALDIRDIPLQKMKNLNLMNTEVDSVINNQSFKDWPNILNIEGFSYNHIGEFWQTCLSCGQSFNVVEQFSGLLARQGERTAYEQLGKLMQKDGYIDQADEIFLEGREVERHKQQLFSGTWTWLTIQRCLTGYGYQKWIALLWIFGFVLIGAYIFHLPEERPNGVAEKFKSMRLRKLPNVRKIEFVYSFDMLIPVIRLNEENYKRPVYGWRKYYLYLHKIVGFILVGFLGAALAGLSK